MKIHNLIRNHPMFEGYELPIMDLLREGKVKINGKRRRTNRDVNVYTDVIEVALNDTWIPLVTEVQRTIIVMYKPRGYLCTHSDPHGRDIVYDLLPEKYRMLHSAGRLDLDSEGLLICTDDGYYLFKLISPEFTCNKIYLVGVNVPFSDDFINQAASGEFVIDHNEREFVLQPVLVEVLSDPTVHEFTYLQLEPHLYWYQFTLTEGRYRQIRKMSEKYSNSVERLIRIQHGDYRLTEDIFRSGYIEVETRGAPEKS